MIIGITGTDGAGKGETVWETVARPCQLFCELAIQNSDTVYRPCKGLCARKSFHTTHLFNHV